jgi:methionyl-tRNA formyltransferase
VQGFLERYPELQRTPQAGEPSVYPRRTPADSELCVDKTLREQFNLLRIGNNESWPSFFVLNGHKYILTIKKAK